MKTVIKMLRRGLMALLAAVMLTTAVTPAPALAVGGSSTLATSGSTYIVIATKLNVRSGPGMGYSILGRAKRGTKCTFVSMSKGWWLVRFSNGKKGYVDKQFLTPVSVAKTGTYTVKTALNVRVSPSVKAKKLGTLKKGTQVNLLKLNGDWAQIYYKGKSGWVAVKYLGK